MQFTAEDKRVFEEFLVETSHVRMKAEVLFKLFYNLAMKFNAIPPELASEVQQFLVREYNDEAYGVVLKGLKEVGVTILSIAEEETAQLYTTGQLAKYFGVSTSTINNWIDAKRFIGFSREKKNKQARISDSTVWISGTGENLTVAEVVKLYEENQKRLQSKPEYEDKIGYMRYLVETVTYYETRYDNRKYENVVAEKGDPSMTDDIIWSREGKEWRSILREVDLV